MLARVHSSAIHGIDPVAVDVEVHVRQGPERFTLIGLGDSAIRESRERIASAILRSGFMVPDQILVNLAPAEIRKEGSAFDLAIALGILIASRQLPADQLGSAVVLGELGLDGTVRPVRGVLARALSARFRAASHLLVPLENLEEAALIGDVAVYGVHSLLELVTNLKAGIEPGARATGVVLESTNRLSLSDVRGQAVAKRGLLVAAVGGHNLLMIGPPGCGKSMLAARLPTLLPPLNDAQRLQTIALHSVAGLPLHELLAGVRPFRTPHHVVSDVGLIGGGSYPRPGEISLAHCGVLFLDEFPEYRRSALEAMRGPLEQGQVTISRASGNLTFPARFQLIAAMNPCPCGRLGQRSNPCQCPRTLISAYLRKLSQPILDRIDLRLSFDPVALETLGDQLTSSEGGDEASQRVAVAHALQFERQGCNNAQLPLEHQALAGALSAKSRLLIRACAERMSLSARGYVRVLRVARSIADLEQSSAIEERHVAEALSFRALMQIERLACAA